MRKPDKIGAIIYAAAFAASVALLMASVVCMLSDIHIWHRLMPIAIAVTAVTGIAFVVSILLYSADVKKARSEERNEYATESESPTDKRKARISNIFKIATASCFVLAVGLSVASRFCSGFTYSMLLLFSAVAAFSAVASAVVAVVLSRRKASEKAAVLGIISMPILFLIAVAAIMAVFGGALLYLVIVSWAQWGLL